MDCLAKRREYIWLNRSIKNIAKNYFSAKEKLKKHCEPQHLKFVTNRFIKRVEKAYSKLDNLDQYFINNEFFYEAYPFWWKKIYSKTTYYRLMRKSMTHFKEAFDNET